MSQHLMVELLIPEERLTLPAMQVTVAAMLAAGFRFERVPEEGGKYWLIENLEWRQVTNLDETWVYYGRPGGWGIELWKPSMARELRHVIIEVTQAPEGMQETLGRISLSTILKSTEEDPTLFREFLAWVAFLVGLTNPWYGWGGGNIGLQEPIPIDVGTVTALKPQAIEWLNIYGPSYVKRIGLQRLTTAPAWRIDTLVDGSVMLVLAEDQYTASTEAAHAVERHLAASISD